MKKTLTNLLRYQIRQGIVKGLVILAKFRKKSGLIVVHPSKTKFPFWLRSNTSDIPTFDEVFIAKQYEFEYGFIPQIIIDCGANIGLSTIFFKNKFPNATIISIEPEISNFDMLQKNVSPYQNIHCEHAGVWSKETKLLGSNKYGDDNWTFSVVEAIDETIPNLMQATSIDNIIKKYNINYIDLLKIDIEGAELELFSENTEGWLPKTKCIAIELHDRLRKGSGTAFFKATSKYDFSYFQNGVNLFCINNSLV